MSTTRQNMEVGLTAKDVENASQTMLNLMRDSDDLVIGSGFRHPFPEMAEAIQLAEKARKREEEKRHKQLVDAVLADIRAMEADMANFENNKFGGLGGLGAQVGVARKPGESDEDYRKSIRDNIQVQLVAGTLEDPDGDIREWARQYDEIEEKKAYLGQERKGFVSAVKSGDIDEAQNSIQDDEVLMIPKNEIEDDRVLSVRNEELDKRDSQNVTVVEAIEKNDEVDSFAADFLAAFTPIQENFATAAAGHQAEPQASHETAPPTISPNMIG